MTFAFYCPRCQRPTGAMGVEGVMLAVWWLNAEGGPSKKWSLKTLKSGSDYLNLLSVSPARPAAAEGKTTITFMATLGSGPETPINKSAIDVFNELLRQDIQEWQIQ
ncbi:MAG TPA: hypothetical protein VJS44_09990 [Pyrinomonadaceae bacterium]|nr:hypothetical protein [Pyrinomonadaceae bacterium]